jgi:hypothetical protein
MLIGLAGCAGDRQVVLAPPVPPQGQGVLAQQQSRAITLLPVRDLRPGNRMLGETTAAFGVKMGDNFSTTDVPALIRDTIAAEFQAARHVLDTSGVPVQITIHEFQCRTDTTPLYWDIIATADIELGIGSTTRRYQSKGTAREWVNPGADLMARLLNGCLADVGTQLRNDAVLASALATWP